MHGNKTILTAFSVKRLIAYKNKTKTLYKNWETDRERGINQTMVIAVIECKQMKINSTTSKKNQVFRLTVVFSALKRILCAV